MKIKIAPSILSSDFAKLGETAEMLERCGADLIHCDVMDGNFVPPITFGAQAVKAIRPHTALPLDCHLMVLHPNTHLGEFVKAGADLISVHAEACGDGTADLWREIQAHGVKACAVVNPETEIEALFPAAEFADMLLVMSVHPGWGGQKFIPESLKKIERLRNHCIRIGRDELDIEVDGGVTVENVGEIVSAGANVIVAGNAVFGSRDIAGTIARLRG